MSKGCPFTEIDTVLGDGVDHRGVGAQGDIEQADVPAVYLSSLFLLLTRPFSAFAIHQRCLKQQRLGKQAFHQGGRSP